MESSGVKESNCTIMKSRSFLLAFALLLTTAASAQHSRIPSSDRDRNSGNQHSDRDRDNNDYDNGDRTDYRTRQSRYAHRSKPVMNSRSFQQALTSIRLEHFDSDKIRMAKFIATRNNLSTVQIRTLAQLLRFDSSKLEFAKYAYVSCADPENYYMLGKIFTFSSSREELMDYLACV